MFSTTDNLNKGSMLSKIHVLMSDIGNASLGISETVCDTDALIIYIDHPIQDKGVLLSKIHVLMSEIACQMSNSFEVSPEQVPVCFAPTIHTNLPDGLLVKTVSDLNKRSLNKVHTFFFGLKVSSSTRYTKQFRLKKYMHLLKERSL